MATITLPPDLENRLTDEASRRGTTPELLVLDSLRKLFVLPQTNLAVGQGQTLFDFLAGHVGTVAGLSEPLSEDCGQRFADGLVEKHQKELR